VNRIDPLVTKILDGYVPLPNAAANRVVRAPNLRDTGGQFGVRFDSKAGASHNVLARYILGRTRNVNPLGGSNFLPASNTATATLQDVTVSDTWVLRNNRINVLRISLNRIDAKPTSSSGVDPRSFGFAYSASDPASAGLPFVLVQGFFSTGDSQQQFASRTNTVFGIADDVTWVTGAHTLKLGGELRRDRIKASYIFDPNGDYTFNGQYSGSAAADFLLGFPSIFRQAVGDPNLDGASWTYAIYGQDELRLGSRVTLNYGLRYELCPPFIEAHDRLNAFHPGQQSRVFPTAPTGLVYTRVTRVCRGEPITQTSTTSRLASPPSGIPERTVARASARPGAFSTMRCLGKGTFFRTASSRLHFKR
jgi:outer membrane receptor protein involved in Fe transport